MRIWNSRKTFEFVKTKVGMFFNKNKKFEILKRIAIHQSN